MIVGLSDLDRKSREGEIVPWGKGVGQVGECLREMHRLGIRPVTFGLSYGQGGVDRTAEIRQCVEFFNRTCLELAEEKPK